MKKTILILTSDPFSINYEIIKKSQKFFKKKINNRYLFVGDQKDVDDNIKKNNKLIDFLNVKRGTNTKVYLKKCFELAFKLLKNKEADGLINLPLNKRFLPGNYAGFTEYIADAFNKKGKETMLLYNQNFSVCPNTTHIKIKDVSRNLNQKKIITNITNIDNFYKNIPGVKRPVIGVMGLNPHSGMDFEKNTEENSVINPAIKKLIKNKIRVIGPLVPDVAFNEVNKKKINCLVGHYHDQVLPTFKYIHKFDAINITLGLPFLRISPDHGTASNLRNKNLANPESFIAALKFFEKHYKKI
ncbi:4-hydroxythreonine-4-phosphate dehydrogenase PdxA [Pelagibacteraceae bacterium]|nr:4-hydroxythreonine-4-phosphate dehydrogenase PdxA [Pelagibacteraceae bacterium]